MTLFSTYSSLKERNNKEGIKAVDYTLGMACLAYITTAIPNLFMYGSSI